MEDRRAVLVWTGLWGGGGWQVPAGDLAALAAAAATQLGASDGRADDQADTAGLVGVLLPLLLASGAAGPADSCTAFAAAYRPSIAHEGHEAAAAVAGPCEQMGGAPGLSRCSGAGSGVVVQPRIAAAAHRAEY